MLLTISHLHNTHANISISSFTHIVTSTDIHYSLSKDGASSYSACSKNLSKNMWAILKII